MISEEEKEREENLRKLWCYVKDIYQKLPKHDPKNDLRKEYEKHVLLRFLHDIDREILYETYKTFDKHWEQRLKKDD